MKELSPELKQQIEKEATESANRQRFHYPADVWSTSEVAEREHASGYEIGAEVYAIKLQVAEELIEKMAKQLEDALLPSNKTVIGTIPSFMVARLEDVLMEYYNYKQQKDDSAHR